MGKHNKKRNVGLIHEQLVKYASQMIVEGKTNEANKAVDLVIKHYKNDSELLREFKLFGALIHTVAENREMARRIISESKRISALQASSKLDFEKTKLIKEINSTFGLENVYSLRVEDYKLFATVQTLLNEWRGASNLGPEEIVRYEKLLEDHLIRENNQNDLSLNENANPLILKLMIEKFNSKYSNSLNYDQKALLEAKLSGDEELLVERMKIIKSNVRESLESFFDSCSNSVLNSKKKDIVSLVESFEPKAGKEEISKALILANLMQELENQ
jgi:hypothetical protein